MDETQSIALSTNVKELSTGLVLVFSRYNSGALDANFHTFFVPKPVITSGQASMGVQFFMSNSDFSAVCSKLLFISNTKISGYVSNYATGTGSSGIKYANNAYVLRAVYGV
jgi:hypothetical protein